MPTRANSSSPSGPLRRLAIGCLLLLIFSLAFAKPTVPIAGLKATLTDLLFLLMAAAWAAALIARQARLRWHPLFWLIALYFASMLLSGIFSTQPSTSAVKLATQVYLLSLPPIVYSLLESESDLKAALTSWLGASVVVVLVGIATMLLWSVGLAEPVLHQTIAYQGTLPRGDYPRLALTFETPAMLCNYLTASLAILLVCLRKGWIAKRPALLLSAAFCILALLTFTPGLGGVPLLLGTWYWLVMRSSHPRGARAAVAAGSVAAFLFFAASTVTPYLHRTAPFLIPMPSLGTTLAPTARTMFWIDAWENFLERPLFGSGIGTNAVLVKYEYPDGAVDTLIDAHNVFLSIAAQCGIVGLAALLAMVIFIARNTLPLKIAPDRANLLRLGLGLGYLNCFVYQGLTGSYEDARHLWVLLGLFLVGDRLEQRRNHSGKVI